MVKIIIESDISEHEASMVYSLLSSELITHTVKILGGECYLELPDTSLVGVIYERSFKDVKGE